MRVKVCGLRRAADADVAISLGATHVGVVLAADSPRRASRAEARAIVALAAGCAEPVLVFRGESDREVRAACEELSVRRVQVHGADARRCAQLERAGLLPIPVAEVTADAVALPSFTPAPSSRRPALLDGGRGGAGRRFRWDLLADGAPEGVLVAGGIEPANVRELLEHRPWGIDVSSGVELGPGVKDPERLTALFQAVRSAEVGS